MRISGQMNSGDAVAWIGVASPSSPHRIESMRSGIFHIGRSKACHLRLGDEAIPDLLAVIVADRISARISSQCSSPQLLLNGQPVEDAPLSDGDLLEAGPYTLVFRRLSNGAISANQDEGTDLDASQATAPQLVDALEDELATVEELEHTPVRGWQELATRLVQEEASSTAQSPTSETRDVIPIDDIQSLLRNLLKGQQSLRLQQEAILRELADLKRNQSQLADAVLPPAESVVKIRPAGPIPPHRASA